MDSKYENRVQRIVLSCDSFTTGYCVMLLLFSLPYAVTVNQLVAIWFLPLVCIVPLAVMPILYSVIHRFAPLLFGRYHLFMPLSAFLSSLFFVLFFSAGMGAGGALGVFFCALLHIVLSMVYRYCSFSVRARLVGDSVFKPSAYTRVFGALGGIAAFGTVCGFYYYDPSTALLNTAYVVAAACVILALVQYLTSFYSIPKLGGQRVQSIKSVFRTFYGGLRKRTYFSSLFYVAAFFALMMTGVLLFAAEDATIAAIAAAVGIFVFFAVGFVCAEYMRRRTWLPSAINLVCILVSATLMIIAATVTMSRSGVMACAVVSAILIGGGGAVAMRQMRLRFLTIKPRITSGTVYILYELTLFAAAAVALVVGAVGAVAFAVWSAADVFAYACAAAVAFAIVGFAVSTKRSARADDVIELSYELKESDVVKSVVPSTAEQDEVN